MDIDLIKTFLEVSRTRHFGRAAKNLFVTPAAISARIKLMESQLGVELFIRHRGNIRLTSEGERLLPYAETMLETWARAVQEVRLQPELDARVHIGATSGLWLLSMQQKLQALTDGLPGLAIQAEGHSSEELARKLAERTLDMVLLYDPPSDTDVQADKVGELKLVLASNVAACPVNQAIREGYIYVDWGTSFASFHARRFGERATARLNVNLASIAISYLEAKPGAAYLPLSTVESISSLHRLPEAPSFKRPIFACYRESNDRQAVIQEVVRLIHGVVI